MERGGGRAGWIREWDEGEKKRRGWMDVGVGRGREKGAGLDGWGSRMSERGGGEAERMENLGEGKRS